MAYLPQNKYKKYHTDGKDLKFKSTNKPYKGPYILTSGGKLFAGETPQTQIGELIPIAQPPNSNINKNPLNNRKYQLLQPRLSKEQGAYKPIPEFKPIPTALDYSKGFFNRYLSVKLNTKQYKEISQQTYRNFKTGGYNKVLNKVFLIKWFLTEDNEEKNTKSLRDLEYKVPGLFNFFPDKDQYGLRYGVVRIGTTSRVYPTGAVIPSVLPAAYQTGNSKINSIDNPNVPENQYCGNCIFNQKLNCTRWKANIQNNYWCRAYKSKQKVMDMKNEVKKSLQKQSNQTPTSQPTSTPSPQTTPSPSISSPSPSRGGGY